MTIIKPLKFFAGFLFSQRQVLDSAISECVKLWGPVDYQSLVFDFSSSTQYYEDEFGDSIKRIFVSFEKLIQPETLMDIKEASNSIEAGFIETGKRKINIDPGYMDTNKVVLASCKYDQQKIHLGKGIWADITLLYAKGEFYPLNWTFPDFKKPDYYNCLLKIRDNYKRALKNLKSK